MTLLLATLLGLAAGTGAGPAQLHASPEVFESFKPDSGSEPGAWVLGSVITGTTVEAYSPIFMETFDDYASGPLPNQGPWIRNASFAAFHDVEKHSHFVTSGEDQFAEGRLGRDTTTTCFFPNIFAEGNTKGRIEFDFRRGCLELDIRLGPAANIDGVTSNAFDQSFGGQFAGYYGGCFTPFYRGGFHGPQITAWPWQAGTFYHMVMDFEKSGSNIAVRTEIDGIFFEKMSGPFFTITSPLGLNALTIRGADFQRPVHAVDNIKVSIPAKSDGTAMNMPWSIIP